MAQAAGSSHAALGGDDKDETADPWLNDPVLTFAVDDGEPAPVHVAHREAANGASSLPPSEIIRAINEGSIALRIGAEKPAWASIFVLDESTGSLRRMRADDEVDAIHVAVNDLDGGDTQVLDAAYRFGPVGMTHARDAGWQAPTWLDALRKLKERWL